MSKLAALGAAREVRRADTLWRYDDVAHYLALSLKTIQRRAVSGELPSIRIGTARRFDPEAIRAYARAHSTGSPL